jgi:hypothetical protein
LPEINFLGGRFRPPYLKWLSGRERGSFLSVTMAQIDRNDGSRKPQYPNGLAGRYRYSHLCARPTTKELMDEYTAFNIETPMLDYPCNL